MTILRMVLRWSWLFLAVEAMPVLAMAASPPPSEVRARATIPAIAVVPRITWEPDEAQPPGLEPGGIYIFRPDRPAGTRVGFSPKGNMHGVALSPVGDLLAILLDHIDPNDHPGEPSAEYYEIAVVDSSGDSATAFPRAVRLAWRPDGIELAVGIGPTGTGAPLIDSVFVWDPRSHGIRGSHIPETFGLLGWCGKDTLLIGPSPPAGTIAVNVRTRAVSKSRHQREDLSPDRSYSIGPSTTGALRSGIYSEKSGADLTQSAVKLLHLPDVQLVQAAWVAYPNEGHLACVSGCTAWTGPASGPRHRTCRTGLVDVKRMRLVGWTEGRLIGPTSEGTGAVVTKDGAVRFLSRGDWTAGPVPQSPQSAAGPH